MNVNGLEVIELEEGGGRGEVREVIINVPKLLRGKNRKETTRNFTVFHFAVVI